MRTQHHSRLLRFPRALTLLLALMPALPALASPSDVTLAARTVVEGDSGLTRLSLPLARRGDLGYDFAVSLRTVDDATAAQPATAGADYTASVGQLVLRSGTLRTHYDLDIVGERVVEADERFLVRLSAAVGVGRGAGPDHGLGASGGGNGRSQWRWAPGPGHRQLRRRRRRRAPGPRGAGDLWQRLCRGAACPGGRSEIGRASCRERVS
jgi:hypothetical protein